MRERALNPFVTLIEFVGWLLVLCRQSFSKGMLYRKAPSGNFLLLSIVCLITACDFPQWRNEQEFSYGAEKPSIAKGIKPSYAVMISSRSQQSRELSKSWGKEAISEIVVHKDLFQEAMEGVIEKIESQETGGK